VDGYLHIGNTQVNFTLKNLTGMEGLGVRRLNFRFDVAPLTPASFGGHQILMESSVSIQPDNLGPKYAGRAFCTFPGSFPTAESGHQIKTDLELGLDLSQAQLEAIEEHRQGSWVFVVFDVLGVLIGPEPRRFWGQMPIRVEKAAWGQALEQLGYSKLFILDVPLAASAQAAKGVRWLEEAVAALNDGRYRHAVAACRDLIEDVWGSEAGFPAFAPTFKNKRQAGKDVRFWWTRQGVLQLTHAAKHADEVAVQIEWTRQDAVAAIRTIAALLQQDLSSTS
jgi:hypothetical protein